MQALSPFILIALLVPAGLAGPAHAGEAVAWTHYGADLAGSRHSSAKDIGPGNVDELSEVWRYRTRERQAGAKFKATPLYADGRLFVVTGRNRILALDPATGRELWAHDPTVDFGRGEFSEQYTARGLASWGNPDRDGACATRLFLGTIDARLLAVDARTGKPCVDFGRGGTVDLSKGIARYRRLDYSVTSPPLVVGDLVVVGSSIGDNGAIDLEPGTVRAFDALTGAPRWSWDPIPRRDDAPGADSWRGEAVRRTGGANVWSMMSADPELGLIYLPTTSPSPDFFGGERLGANRFANSVVALEAATGEVRWDFQTTHHDLWDHDLASQPVLADIGDRKLLVQATKMGLVFVLDRVTGEPVFGVEERPVPQSDVPGEVSSATQPFPLKPRPLHPISIDLATDRFTLDEAHDTWCREELERVRYEGIYTPPSLRGSLLYPGNFGGTNWGSVTIDAARGLALLAVNRLPTIVRLIPRREFDSLRRELDDDPRDIEFTAQRGAPYGMLRYHLLEPTTGAPCLAGPWGSIVAIDLASGEVAWERPAGHEDRLAGHPEAATLGSLLAGGAITTASGLTVFATRGDRALYVLATGTGEVLRRIELPAGSHATPMSYRHAGRQYVLVAAGGADRGDGEPGDYLLAFGLPAE